MRLAGKVAIVTGGAQGIGRGIVLCMAKEGADIAIADLKVDGAGQVAAEVAALGRKAIVVKTDVTKQADFEALYEAVKKELGKIDILVNNAGTACPPGNPFTKNVEEDWDRVWSVNVKSIFFACKAIAPYFLERKCGKIVNIASIAGTMNSPNMPPYSAFCPNDSSCRPRFATTSGVRRTPATFKASSTDPITGAPRGSANSAFGTCRRRRTGTHIRESNPPPRPLRVSFGSAIAGRFCPKPRMSLPELHLRR